MSTYRFPIRVSAFVEVDLTKKDVRVIVDQYDWDWAAWPRVNPYGDDKEVMQIDDGLDADGNYRRRIESDVDITNPIRGIAEQRLDSQTPWTISKHVEEDITDGTA